MNGLLFSFGAKGSSRLAFAALLTFLTLAATGLQASDMPTAAGSPIAGINFDDRPLMLPIQRNFQMAMLTTSSELGRTCGKMEAYGWRVGDNEQARVNQIFNNTVDRLRAQGYVVEAKTSRAISRDVTLFTADREDKRLMMLWSAGEIGLVLVLCETSAPLAPTPRNILALPEAGTPAPMREMVQPVRTAAEDLRKPIPLTTRTGKPAHESFSPLGSWVGGYSCVQGTTGATFTVESLKGDQFKGTFRFYPTGRNPNVPAGKYEVFGEYDRDSQRILINPGKWINRPKDYYNTIMIGSFDPVNRTFSAYFQGITGCTSFEAHQGAAESPAITELKVKPVKVEAAAPAKAKKTTKKKAAKPAKPSAAPSAAVPERGSSLDVPSGIDLPMPAAAP